MLRRPHLLWILLTCGAAIAPVGRATAQTGRSPARPAAAPEGPLAERQRLRADLARVQAEIDQLKQSGRGLRTDYLLRGRQADAEALARRLTELDAALRARAATPGTRAPAAPPRSIGDEPAASPTDGPAELEAKADILADQAHRVEAQAAALKVRVDQARGRRELRRRAHQLDNDPFAPLEGSRRRLLTTGPPVPKVPAGAGTTDHAVAPTPGPVSSDPPRGVGVAGATTPTAAPTPTPLPTAEGTSPAASAQVQVHDVLDPGALAQARRTDPGVAQPTDLESMERALMALTTRAQHLDAQSKLLRARAHAR